MTNRRKFLQIGLAATTLPLAGGVLAEMSPSGTAAAAYEKLPLYKVVFDERFAIARAFGQEAALLGVSTMGFLDGDITDFWFNDLDLRWREAPVAIAGFTQHGPLFVLERLAWDRGLKVVFRAEHRLAHDCEIEHRVTGSRQSVAHAATLSAGGEQWSRTMAAVVTQCPSGCSDITNQTIVTAGKSTLLNDEPFYSWVIAPRLG
jgi:hypothetical protein